MRTVLVPGCCIGVSTLKRAVLTDIYLIVGDDNVPLWHENLFLIDIAQSYGVHTCKAYANDLLSFTRMSLPLGGWKSITQVTINGYLGGDLVQSRKYKEVTLIRHISTLKKFFSWLYRKGYLDSERDFYWVHKKYYSESPNDSSAFEPSQHSHHSAYIDIESYRNLLSHVQSGSSFHTARDRICIRLGYETGTRAHEVLGLNFKKCYDLIEKSKNKNCGIWATTKCPIIGKGNKQRVLFLPPSLCEEINILATRFPSTFYQQSTPLICQKNGTPIQNTKHASYVYTRAQICSALPRKGHQGYHALRKSFGTNLVNECHKNGLDPWVVVPRRMGHKSVETTLGYIYFEALLHGRSELLGSLRMMEFKGILNDW